MKRFLILLVIAGVAVGGYLAYQRYQQAQAASRADYQTQFAERGDLTATVGATGTVRANQSTVLTWQTTGTVGQIMAQLGETVQSGDVIATLVDTSVPQNVILAKAELVEAKRALNNLLNSDTARAQAELTLVQAREAFEDAERKRNNLNYRRGNDTSVDTAKADLILAQNAVDRAQEYFDSLSHRDESDADRAVALSQLSAAKRKRDQAQANLNWFQGSATEKEITEAESELAVAQANLADAEREWERLKDGPDPEDIAAAEARVLAIQATLDQLEMKAPFTATITELGIKPGDRVSPEVVAFRLDDLSHLLVDVPVSEVDINRIRGNQPVLLTFDAIPDKEFEGTVIDVARIGTATQGVVNFNITVEIIDPGDEVRPGMTAAVNVVVSQLKDVLLVPNRAVRLFDNQRVVYLLDDEGLNRVEIVLGASSDTVSEVISGDIQEGDTIVLNPPTEFNTNGRPPFMGGR